MVKKCNVCEFQQEEFLNKNGRDYCKYCDSEISINSEQILAQKQKTLHQMKLLLGNFHYMLEPLEEYIEKAGYYPNFRSRRQLYRKSIKDSEGPLWNDEDLFLTQLFVFAAAAHGKPQFFREVIREEFYKWINYTGITANNCPERLKHFLIEVNNILDGNDEKILRETREKNKNIEVDPKEVVGIFSSIQQPLSRNREQRVTLEGKNWSELSDDDKFEGDLDLGKQTFLEIEGGVSVPHEQFMLRKSEAEILRQLDEMFEGGGSSMEGIESSNSQSGSSVSQPTGEYKWVDGRGWTWFPASSQQDQKQHLREGILAQGGLGENNNKSNGNLGTILLITGILALASLGIYGVIKVKKSKKIKNNKN